MSVILFKGKSFQVVQGSTHPQYSLFTFNEEEKDFRDQYWNINDGDVVFDVGASYGSYALPALAMGATVYAFEPEKSVFYDLERNVKLNNFVQPYKLHDHGLWDSECSVHMGSYAPHWPQQTISGEFQMKTLDQVVEENNLAKLNWLKIDVEGAEENVIRGGLKSIAKFQPQIIVECHIFLNEKLVDGVKSLLSSACNYEFEEISRPPCIMVYAKPRNG